MPTYFAKRSSIPTQLNYWGSFDDDRVYNDFYQFNQSQSYEGEFFRDSLHGQGTYKWHSLVYEGGFYSNSKEGYACLSFPDNSHFEGLFVKNEPFGPGILTYANGRQDAGFWKGTKLVRLSRPVDFIIPRLAPTSAAKIKLLQFRRLIPLEEDNLSITNILLKYEHPLENFSDPYSPEIYDPRSIFFDKQLFETAYFAHKNHSTEFPSNRPEEDQETESLREISPPAHCLCPNEVFVMRYDDTENVDNIDICEEEGEKEEGEMGILGYYAKYGTAESLESQESEHEDLNEEFAEEEVKDTSKIPKIVSWNRSDLCTEMLKQIFRFRDFEEKLSFNLSKLMVGARNAFRKTGETEKQCLHFLKMCSLGPADIVKSILCCHHISEELMDARGNNSVMFAAATDQHEVIDVLLNYGVDVNTFNDEGLTPLNLCLLRRLALANGISSWETAFLPKEIDEIQEDSHTQEYPTRESIPSLDRIFGDGMSMNESNILGLDSKSISPSTSPRANASLERHQLLDSSKSWLAVSSSKIQGSTSLINWEWELRTMKSSYMRIPNPTPTLNVKIVPKSIRRDEFQKSIQKSSKDKYLFEMNFKRNAMTVKEEEESLQSVKKIFSKNVENSWEDTDKLSRDIDLTLEFDVAERISKVDETIKLILNRGADPSICEVPKPSLHLGIYTKDFYIVYNLLFFGANPDSPLHRNEGLLAPLHVIALQEPTSEYVGMCELLLNFNASPDVETLPGFFLYEEEKQYLDTEKGRTPLHLLCMRPDLEYVDQNGILITIALTLAKISNRANYNGHSCLTLAMLFGNLKLLQALLRSKLFDPKEILGKNRGTCLHVLVSSELQKRTPYETSIKMCKMLLRAGADPLIKFKHPRSLAGTCVDYGYREIEAEKEARKAEKGEGKNGDKSRKEKGKEADYLKDHERIVQFLARRIARKTKTTTYAQQSTDVEKSQRRKSSGRPVYEKKQREKSTEGEEKVEESSTEEGSGDESARSGEEGEGVEMGDVEKEGKKLGRKKKGKGGRKSGVEKLKDVADDKTKKRSGYSTILWDDQAKEKKGFGKNKEDATEEKGGKGKKKRLAEGKDTTDKEGGKGKKKGLAEGKDITEEGGKGKKKRLAEGKDTTDKEGGKGKKKRLAEGQDITDKEGGKGKKKRLAEGKDISDKDRGKSKKKRLEEDITDRGKGKKKRPGQGDKDIDEERGQGKKKRLGQGKKDTTDEEGSKRKEEKQGKKGLGKTTSAKGDKEKTATAKEKKRTPEGKEGKKVGVEDTARKRGESDDKREHKRESDDQKDNQGTEKSRSITKVSRIESDQLQVPSSFRSLRSRNISSSETFPEKLRQILLRMYGSCASMDINEFLMPYVVLRDGELYYKFKGDGTRKRHKEQYSLV